MTLRTRFMEGLAGGLQRFVLGWVALCGLGCAAPQGPALLEPVADESSVERALVRSLQEDHAISSELVLQDDDAIVLTSFRTQSEYWRITINSEKSSQDGRHRVIMVVLDGDFGVDGPDLEKARALINAHNGQFWAGVFFIDGENDILGKWALNMPGVGMHPEMVADAVQRISQSWLELLAQAQDQGIVRIRHAQRAAGEVPTRVSADQEVI